jgi:hypothetical protein
MFVVGIYAISVLSVLVFFGEMGWLSPLALVFQGPLESLEGDVNFWAGRLTVRVHTLLSFYIFLLLDSKGNANTREHMLVVRIHTSIRLGASDLDPHVIIVPHPLEKPKWDASFWAGESGFIYCVSASDTSCELTRVYSLLNALFPAVKLESGDDFSFLLRLLPGFRVSSLT